MKEFKRPKPNCPIHGNASIKMQNYIGKTDEGYEFDREGLKIAYCNICNEYYFNDYRYPDKLGMHKITAHSINGMIKNNREIMLDNETLYLCNYIIPEHCVYNVRSIYEVYGVVINDNKVVKIECQVCRCCGKIFILQEEYDKRKKELKTFVDKNRIMIDELYFIKDINEENINEIFRVCRGINHKCIAAVNVRENDVLRIYGIISVKNIREFDEQKYERKGILLDKSAKWWLCIKKALRSKDRKYKYGHIEYEIKQYILIDDDTRINFFNYAQVNKVKDFTDISNGKISIQVYQQNRCKCEKNNHNIQLVEVKIKNVFDNNVDIRCFYCKDCDKYYIQQALLDYYLKQYRGLICLIDGYKVKESGYYRMYDFEDLPAKSKLRLYGYNVSDKAMTSVKRHKLINTIIKYNLMKPNEIITQINKNMHLHKRHELAISKWKEDIAFIEQNYMREGKIIIEGDVRFYN